MPAHRLASRPSYVQSRPDQLLFDFDSRDLKVCQRCGVAKPLDEFYRMKRGRHGRQPDCKRCRVDRYGSEDYKRCLALKERGLKACNTCGRELPFEMFGTSSNGFRHQCHECRRVDGRANYAANAEAIRAQCRERYRRDPRRHNDYTIKSRRARRAAFNAYCRKWHAAHPEVGREAAKRRKARKMGAAVVPFTFETLQQKLAYWGKRCWMCGGEPDTVDHVKPLARGGYHIIANFRPACRSCNSRKADKWPLASYVKGY